MFTDISILYDIKQVISESSLLKIHLHVHVYKTYHQDLLHLSFLALKHRCRLKLFSVVRPIRIHEKLVYHDIIIPCL